MSMFKSIRKPIVCKDGFQMSVQASENHYSSPRADSGPYTHVEVGFPSEGVDDLMPYSDEGLEDPTDEVYGFVPVCVVAKIILDHGGQETEADPFTLWVNLPQG